MVPSFLDAKSLRIVHEMMARQDAGVAFTLSQISEALSIPRKTVERKLTALKSAGLLSSSRVGRISWVWDFSPFRSAAMAPQIADMAPQPVVESPAMAPQMTPQRGPSDDPSSASDRFIIHDTVLSNQNETALDCSTQYSPGEEEKMRERVTGPDSQLVSSIKKILNTPRIQKIRGVEVMDSNETPSRRLRSRMLSKKPVEYNVTDMRFLFEDIWSQNNWKGFPPRWTMKDKHHVREILDEQGGAVTVQYFTHVLQNWPAIQRRYRITGAPSVRVLYGFRGSLLHEALNKTPTGPTVEYVAQRVTEDETRF